MTNKQKLWIIQRISKLLYLYFGGTIKMNKQNNNMQVPTFLQKATEAAKAKTTWEEPIMEAIDAEGNIQQVHVESYDAEENVTGRTSGLSAMEKQTLIEHVKGMSKEQLDLMLDNIPIEMVYNRLGRELERNKAFMNSIKGSMALIDSK